MPKRTKVILYIGLVLVILASAGVGATIGVSAYLDRMYASLHSGCYPRTPNHTITIQDDSMAPSTITMNKCDTLTITNLDDASRMMAFGQHDQHVAYDGVTEKMINKGESFTVTLIESGRFIVHDHNNEDVTATFTVVSR